MQWSEMSIEAVEDRRVAVVLKCRRQHAGYDEQMLITCYGGLHARLLPNRFAGLIVEVQERNNAKRRQTTSSVKRGDGERNMRRCSRVAMHCIALNLPAYRNLPSDWSHPVAVAEGASNRFPGVIVRLSLLPLLLLSATC